MKFPISIYKKTAETTDPPECSHSIFLPSQLHSTIHPSIQTNKHPTTITTTITTHTSNALHHHRHQQKTQTQTQLLLLPPRKGQSPPPLLHKQTKKPTPTNTHTHTHSAPNLRPLSPSPAASSHSPTSRSRLPSAAQCTSANAPPQQTSTYPPARCFSPARADAPGPPTARRYSWCCACCWRACWHAVQRPSGCSRTGRSRRRM